MQRITTFGSKQEQVCTTAVSSTSFISWSKRSCWSCAHCDGTSLITASMTADVFCRSYWTHVSRVYQLTPVGPAQRCLTHDLPSPYTQLDAECDQQPAIVDDCRPQLPRRPVAVSVNNRPTAVAVYIALANGRRAVAKYGRPRIFSEGHCVENYQPASVVLMHVAPPSVFTAVVKMTPSSCP